jgi:hypothetical protein
VFYKASEEEGVVKLVKTNQREHKGKAVTELQRESNKYIVLATSLGDHLRRFLSCIVSAGR